MRCKQLYSLLCVGVLILLTAPHEGVAHPLRLSLTEIEYTSDTKLLNISLRLFVMDINNALVFDPESKQLALGQANEAENAEQMLLDYLKQFFYIKVNGRKLDLKINSKRLQGEGINTALGVNFELTLEQPLTSLEIMNAVFTDLFFDQSNIVYVHVNGDTQSLLLNKETPVHLLEY